MSKPNQDNTETARYQRNAIYNEYKFNEISWHIWQVHTKSPVYIHKFFLSVFEPQAFDNFRI